MDKISSSNYPLPSPKMVRSNLPEECLVMIFQHLRHDRSTLHALLQVDHQFFRLAVPVLYRSPFRLLESKAESWSWVERTQRQVLLLQLFMRAVQIKQSDRLEGKYALRQRRMQQQDRMDNDNDIYPHRISTHTKDSCDKDKKKAKDSSKAGTETVKGDDPAEEKQQLTRSLRFSTTLSKRRKQQWWSKRRTSTSPSPSPSPSPSLSFGQSFSQPSISKKESNLTDVPGKVQEGRQTGLTLFREHTPAAASSTATQTPTTTTATTTNGLSDSSAQQTAKQRQQQQASTVYVSLDGSTQSTDLFMSIPGEYHSQPWRSNLQSDPFPKPNLLDWGSRQSRDQRHVSIYLGPSRISDTCEHSDSNDTPASDDPFFLGEASDSSLTDEEDTDHYDRHQFSADSTDIEYDYDAQHEDSFVETIFSPGLTTLDPQLGPFSPKKDNSGTRNWAQTLQQRLGSISGSNDGGYSCQESASAMDTRLMTDYLAYYVEHDHPRLARVLPSIFPNLPAESFDQLLTSKVPSAAAPSSEGSSSPSHPMLSIFHSLQQSHKTAQNLERAHSAHIRVERDLLHHSPQRIRTLSLSASRIQAITPPPQRHPLPSKTGSRSMLPGRLTVSPFSSLMSLLSSSPFSKSSTAPVSSASSWHSSASTSTVFSSLSDHSTTPSSICAGSSYSWTGVPSLSKLNRLYRVELYDIHHDFDVEAVVSFFTLHDRTYDTIREVKVGGPNDLGRWSHPGVIQILQALRTVKLLDMIEWREATKYLDQIPTRHLETLLLGNVRMTTIQGSDSVTMSNANNDDNTTSNTANEEEEDEEGQQHPQIQALQRCRQLRELRMPVLIDGLFEWAVQERQHRVESISPSTCPSPRVSRTYASFHYLREDDPSPVRLENVHLSGTSTGPLISTLIHVVDAFRDSIQVLQSTSWMDSTETLSCCLNLSWTWCLPQLQVLDLQGEIAFRFRIQTLQHCSMLRVLRLSLPHSVLRSSTARSVVATGQHDDDDAAAAVDVHPLTSGVACERREQPLCSLADYFGRQVSPIPSQCSSVVNGNNSSTPFQRLQELKLVGDWGLTDESLLGIADAMPRLTRLSLLRCDNEALTAQGLIHALPSLRQRPQEQERVYRCRVRWLQVSKGWQGELEAALADRDKYKDLVDAVEGGVCPLEIAYQY
ncbi:hypothetical protein BC939DRAFT_463463 [Gamsiella multidivaricata]|uniref:uncharacterized protein n=1 Tax=Gamsiella multidivaricata TaxID=101098 RepID=UPI0022209EA2|nr:uncharacterized protein BC939DRAFT_463463 [Gamsiella multidivaricata]KAG0368173.1 hypothetical protein BGZ54_002528 [Gamsiella multidivaricata]KAI7818273.1 hypothetical protein BC939DRAFT_463463 [Gamsiella multidivaricata]